MIVFLTLIISFQYLFWFFALLGEYWYISLPLFLIISSLIYFLLNKQKKYDIIENFDSKPAQEEYEQITSNKPLINGKPTSMYIKWLREKFTIRKRNTKMKLCYSLKGLALCFMLVIIISALYILWSNIILQNLPLFRTRG
jgi:hypothetical protein